MRAPLLQNATPARTSMTPIIHRLAPAVNFYYWLGYSLSRLLAQIFFDFAFFIGSACPERAGDSGDESSELL